MKARETPFYDTIDAKDSTSLMVLEWNTSMEHSWHDNDGRKLKYLEKNLSQSHSVHHKSHMNWSVVIESVPSVLRRESRDWLSH